jgi:aldose 1-epimerase
VRPPVVPSGAQAEITAGGYAAATTEVGGGLRTLTLDGRPLVAGYAETARCDAGRGQVLVPWPNRVADGRYTFDGHAEQLALSQPSEGHAIHGLTRWSNWLLVEHTADTATWAHRLHPQPGYPHALDLRVGYRLAASQGLTVHLEARNVGASRAPFGAGFHPYLTAGSDLVDADVLTLPAATVLYADSRSIPDGEADVAAAGLDFRGGRPIGAVALDHGFGTLAPDPADGRIRVTLAGRDRSTTLWADAAFRWLQVFTGDGLGPEHARRALAVEPMTCPANALASGTDLLVLEPGEAFAASWGIVAG